MVECGSNFLTECAVSLLIKCRGLRQANHRVLAGDVNARARKTNQSADRGIVHDRTAAIPQHGRNLVLHSEQHASTLMSITAR